MHIESIDYFVTVLNDCEYVVRSVAHVSNGEEWPSLPTLYRGDPWRYIESIEIGDKVTLTVTDEREQ